VAHVEAGVGSRLRASLDAMDGGIAAALFDLGLDDYRPRFSGVVRVLAGRGPCSIGDLAEATGVSHSAASQTVTELRVRGLVSLARGADERRRIVSLAPAARDLLPAIEAEWAATAIAMAELDAELSVPLQTVAAELSSALARRSFRQRIADGAVALPDEDVEPYRSALASDQPAPAGSA
jgi:DNA-binding MarR family transcriptional regulator